MSANSAAAVLMDRGHMLAAHATNPNSNPNPTGVKAEILRK